MAARENVSIAELIRRALDRWLETAIPMSPEERQSRAIAAAKGFETGINDLARNHDKYFADTIDDGKQEYRQLSLVDCTSFVVMRQIGIDDVFAFDRHFAEQGFTVLPAANG